MAKQSTTATTRRPSSSSRGGTPARRPATARRTAGAPSDVTWGFPLGKPNLIGIGIGLALIVIGYLCMSTGMVSEAEVATNDGVWNNSMAVTIAPILLVLGYCVVIPLSILYRGRKAENVEEQGTATGEA